MNTKFTTMNGFEATLRKIEEIECPVCGKMFKPATEHAYCIGKNRSKPVCTYSCMRKWEKGEFKKPKKPQKKVPVKRQYNAREGVAVRIIETGETFRSIYACAKHLQTSGANIGNGLKTGKGYKGYHFEKVKEGAEE